MAASWLLPSSEAEQIVDKAFSELVIQGSMTKKLPPYIVIIIKTHSLEPGPFVNISPLRFRQLPHFPLSAKIRAIAMGYQLELICAAVSTCHP